MKEILISVYGTLRKGNGNHTLIKNAEYKGTFTSEPTYGLYSLGGFPGLKENGNTAVVMEVYSVNEEEARKVDNLEGYTENETPYFYDKKIIPTPWGDAGVYIYVKQPNESSLIKNGDWMNRFQEIKNLEIIEK